MSTDNDIPSLSTIWGYIIKYGIGIVMPLVIIIAICGILWLIALKPLVIADRITDPDRIIYTYEWFQETYNDVIALGRQIETAQSNIDNFVELAPSRTQWTREDRNEFNRLNAVLTGLRMQRDSVIEDYNANSDMVTRSLFKDGDLPYHLQIIEGEVIGVYDE